MTETKQTNRFFLLFLLYFLGASVGVGMLPGIGALSDEAYLLVAQLICFLPPLAVYFLWTKKPVRQTLRLAPLGISSLLLLCLLGIAVQPVMSLLSYLTALFFPNPVADSIDGMLSSGMAVSLLSMAVLPAIFEEASMRGVLLSGYAFLGRRGAVCASALLFAMLHMNPQQFLYAFCVGLLFGVLVERTGSILASVVPHFVINASSVLSAFVYADPAAASAAIPEEISTGAMLASLTVMALTALPGIALLLYLLFRLNPPRAEVPLLAEDGAPYRERFLTPALLAAFLVYALFGLLPYF